MQQNEPYRHRPAWGSQGEGEDGPHSSLLLRLRFGPKSRRSRTWFWRKP